MLEVILRATKKATATGIVKLRAAKTQWTTWNLYFDMDWPEICAFLIILKQWLQWLSVAVQGNWHWLQNIMMPKLLLMLIEQYCDFSMKVWWRSQECQWIWKVENFNIFTSPLHIYHTISWNTNMIWFSAFSMESYLDKVQVEMYCGFGESFVVKDLRFEGGSGQLSHK